MPTEAQTKEKLEPGVFNSMEIKEAIDQVGTLAHEFKNELPNYVKQLAEGHVDCLLKEKMDKLNEALSDAEEAKKNAEQSIIIAKKISGIRDAVKEDRLSPLEKAQRTDLLKAIKALAKPDGFGKEYQSFNDKASAEYFNQVKAYSTGSDPDGGILVRPYLDNVIMQLMQEYTDFRSYASQITISTDMYKQVASEDNTDMSWGDDFSEPDNNTPNVYKQIEIAVKNGRINIIVPQNLIDDSFFDLETAIMQQAARKFAYGEAAAFFSGDGVKQPRGILTYSNGTSFGTVEQIVSGSASAVTFEGIVGLVYSLLSFYTKNAVFMMNRTTLAQVRLLTYGTAFPVPIWEPSLVRGQPSTIMGYPVVYAPNMPTFAANALAIAFGDFSAGYKIVDRVGMTVLRDPFTAYPIVKYRFLKRLGGGLEDYRAIKLQKIST